MGHGTAPIWNGWAGALAGTVKCTAAHVLAPREWFTQSQSRAFREPCSRRHPRSSGHFSPDPLGSPSQPASAPADNKCKQRVGGDRRWQAWNVSQWDDEQCSQYLLFHARWCTLREGLCPVASRSGKCWIVTQVLQKQIDTYKLIGTKPAIVIQLSII